MSDQLVTKSCLPHLHQRGLKAVFPQSPDSTSLLSAGSGVSAVGQRLSIPPAQCPYGSTHRWDTADDIYCKMMHCRCLPTILVTWQEIQFFFVRISCIEEVEFSFIKTVKHPHNFMPISHLRPQQTSAPNNTYNYVGNKKVKKFKHVIHITSLKLPSIIAYLFK